MRIGIVGTGTLAASLANVWARAGHEVAIAGRSVAKAKALAEAVGGQVVGLAEIGVGRDAVLLAVPWDAVREVLAMAGDGLAGTALIDPTNPVRHGEGVVLIEPGRSAAQAIAELAPGARVVKAFTLFPASQWQGVVPATGAGEEVTVVMAGDHSEALAVVATLIEDAGGRPSRLGPLSRARQLEEAAGFVIGLAFSGFDPRSAVPHVPTR